MVECLPEVNKLFKHIREKGVPNLPSPYINGELKFKSIIPSKTEPEAAIRAVMKRER